MNRILKLCACSIMAVFFALGVSGCGGVWLDGKKIGKPVNAQMMRALYYSTILFINEADDFEALCSIFDGVEYTSIEDLSEEDSYVFNGVSVCFYYLSGETADMLVSADGKSHCSYKDNQYITEVGAVDYEALIDLVTKLEQEKTEE